MAGDRGQTPQDFALGVGIFLFAVAFAFSVLPGLATPFETDVGGDEAVRANQVADTAVAHLTLADETPRLNATRTVTFFRFHPVSSDLRRFFGLASTAGVNVTVRNESGIVRLTDATGTPVRLAAGGDPPADRPTAASVRLVTSSPGPPCDPVCRLAVHVW